MKNSRTDIERLNVSAWLILCLTLLLISACAPKPAVQDDPVAGKWSGEYDAAADRREEVSLELRWENDRLSGTVTAGVRSLPLTRAIFKPDTGAITMEFDAQGNGGRTVHYVIEGKVAGTTMSGSWTHDDQRGDFRVTKK